MLESLNAGPSKNTVAAEYEKKIYENLREFKGKKTIVVTAHRLFFDKKFEPKVGGELTRPEPAMKRVSAAQ